MAKGSLLILLIVFNFLLSSGQDSTKSRKIFVIVEEMPVFPGGEEALKKFIEENKSAQCHVGKDYVSFIVDTDGVAKEQHMLSGKNGIVSLCDTAAALKIVDMMPKWTPGKQKGRKVIVQYNIPLIYEKQ